MKKILIYSDCYVYGGCERLMNMIVTNKYIKNCYIVDFSYSNHRVYREGLQKECSNNIDGFYALPIVSVVTILRIISEYNISKFWKSSLRRIIKLFEYVQLIFIYNLIVQILLLHKVKPDIVHINNGGYPAAESCSTMVFACWLTNSNKIIYHINNFATKPTSGLRKLFDNKLNSLVNYFITASKETRLALFSNRKFPLEKILQLPNAIKTETITINREQLLSEYSLPISTFVLCQVAFLSERKGQIYLLKALVLLKKFHEEIYNKVILFFVGNGEDEKKLLDFVFQNGISEKVKFMGFRSDSINFINAADIFLLPSISNEDMPLVILSAMSLGKTIISTKLAGIKEQIDNGVSGILLNPDAISLAQDLMNAITDVYVKRNHNSYGFEAKKRFNEFFSVDQYGKNLEKIYDRLFK